MGFELPLRAAIISAAYFALSEQGLEQAHEQLAFPSAKHRAPIHLGH
jgi:hypothetical protein